MKYKFSKGKSSRKPVLNSNGIDLPITVTIPTTEVESLGYFNQKQTVFVVEVTAFGLSSKSRHSLEDFDGLHAQISGKVSFRLPDLPRSYWWGNDEPHILQERKKRIEVWVHQLLEQPEILSDGEELLMKFLKMPKASAAAVRFVLNTSQHWLERLYETTSEAEGVRVLKDVHLEASLLMVLEAQSSFESKRLACELFARRFRGGEAESKCLAAFLDADDASKTMQARSAQAKVLLSLLSSELPERMPAEVRTSARKALLTMACDSRAAWSMVLLAFLNDQGLSQFLEASQRSGDEGQRLVVELLLRGFEGPVVRRFAQPDLVNERKQLLNELFLSSDDFVRVSMGILLAALLTDAEAYGEANQAEHGLEALRMEFARGPAVTLDLQRLLSEEESWQFLFRLARAHTAAANFALLLMLSMVQPQMIVETVGLQELLVEKLTDREDPQLRGMAARQLLELQARGEGEAVDSELLGRAVASSAMEALSQQEAEVQSLTAGTEEASRRHRLVSQLEASLSLGIESTEAFRAQAKTWQLCLAQGGSEASAACEAQRRAQQAVSSFSSELESASGQLEDGPAPELLCGPADVARKQNDLDRLLEARRDLGLRLSEQQEALQRVTSELEESKSFLAKDASAAIRAAECQAQREALLEELALGQEQAAELDVQMREVCEALSLFKATLEAKRSQPMSQGLQAWMKVREAHESCDAELGNAMSSLQRAAEALKEETRCRASLRGSLRDLVQSLIALDEELEMLQQHDVGIESAEAA